jgi:hypothetical protein
MAISNNLTTNSISINNSQNSNISKSENAANGNFAGLTVKKSVTPEDSPVGIKANDKIANNNINATTSASVRVTGATVQEIKSQGPFQGSKVNPSSPPTNSSLAKDSVNNGKIYRVSAPGVNPNSQPLVFVNGINTDTKTAQDSAAQLSKITGKPVDLVYNNSDPAVGAKKTLDHFVNEAKQQASKDYDNFNLLQKAGYETAAVAANQASGGLSHLTGKDIYTNQKITQEIQRVGLGSDVAAEWAKNNTLHNPPAAQALANNLLSQLKANPAKPVNVVAYSQGGAILSKAVQYLKNNGVSDKDISRLNILTLGAAANVRDFQNAKVLSLSHEHDVVPQYFGDLRGSFGRNVNPLELGSLLTKGFGLEQHLNYLPGQASDTSKGDPQIANLIQRWLNGGISPTAITLNDFKSK